MKWLVIVVVLFAAVPGSGFAGTDDIADISSIPLVTLFLDGKVKQQSEWVRVAELMTYSIRDLASFQIGVRLFVRKDLSASAYQKGRCYLKIRDKGVFHLREYFIYSGQGPVVWVPHLRKQHQVVIYILWEPDAPVVQYARALVGNETLQKKNSWLPKPNREKFWQMNIKDRPAHFQEMTLDDVCLQNSIEEEFPLSQQDLDTFEYQ